MSQNKARSQYIQKKFKKINTGISYMQQHENVPKEEIRKRDIFINSSVPII